MAISPINLSRISQNLRFGLLTDSLRTSQIELLNTQAQIASGRTFVNPSDDPTSAARAADLTQALQRQQQYVANLQHGDNTLAAADDAITEITSLLIEANDIAIQDVGNLTSTAERQADAELIAAIRQQLQVVGNRQFDGRYLFAGRDTTEQPFINTLGGIAYTGDTGEFVTRASDDLDIVVNVPGNVLFGALSAKLASTVDLSPTLTADNRIEDLRGASGQGIPGGVLVFNEAGGVGAFTVDLTDPDTIGDVVDLINAAAADAGSTLTAAVGSTGITITPGGGEVVISDTGTGTLAASLGILTTTPTTAQIDGADLGARVTSLTPVDLLSDGTGIDLVGGLTITNGGETVTVDVRGAETVQDIINRINGCGLSVLATINHDGTGIDIFNQVSGTSLSISEGTGTTATDLGIRTFNSSVLLTDLNDGSGIVRDEGGNDLRITAKDGSAFEVNLDTALTIGDVIDLINTAATDAGVSVSASLGVYDNGIRLVDTTGGGGDLSVASLGLSTVAQDLGLEEPASGTQTELTGADVNPIRTEGVLTALLDLESALRDDDTREITRAAQRLEPLVNEVTRVQGIIGAHSQGARDLLAQSMDTADSTEIFLSQIQDLDYAAAVTELQATTTQFQATMQTSSAMLNLSLLDFLT